LKMCCITQKSTQKISILRYSTGIAAVIATTLGILGSLIWKHSCYSDHLLW